MVDRQYCDPALAAVYDVFNPWEPRGDFDFYLPLAMSAESVLDVGCGTGTFLRGVRHAGHRGRLCGLDPAEEMLALARRREDVEWVLGELTTASWQREFDLVVMTGHAFQVLLTDDEIRAALGAVRSALTDGGRFAFETRNPLARAWDRWIPANVAEAPGPDGIPVRMWHEVHTPVDGELVRFSTTYTSPAWSTPKLSTSTLRFVGAARLTALLREAGLEAERQCGDWEGGPLTATSPEIITIARRAPGSAGA